jgi:hypothetical protein
MAFLVSCNFVMDSSMSSIALLLIKNVPYRAVSNIERIATAIRTSRRVKPFRQRMKDEG